MGTRIASAAGALLLGATFPGCSRPADGAVTIALNWKAEPEFGGLYAAREQKRFEAVGLHVELTGGAGAPVIQMLVAGQVDFGIVNADDVLVARERGDDLVAVFATYQTSPLGIMTHAERGAKSLADVFALGGTLAVEPGSPYVKFLEKKYDLSKLQIVPYGFSVAPFLTAPDISMQCFVTAEPIEARRQGADPKVFLVADSGYDPYITVLAMRGSLVREKPALVKSLVHALRAGWRSYLDDPRPTNALMHGLNHDMDAETFDLGAAAQRGLIQDEWTHAHGLGSMSVERWRELGAQLVDLGILKKAPDPAACFVDVVGD
jgi:NitT/TauT family transport system substrate-binding protein